MEVIYTLAAKEDLEHWEKTNLKLAKRINKLIEAIKQHPFSGLGKPEQLRFEKTEYWSRRINQEHRLVYKISNNVLYIAQCRYHY